MNLARCARTCFDNLCVVADVAARPFFVLCVERTPHLSDRDALFFLKPGDGREKASSLVSAGALQC